jgi:eukaryotic-like serine/threonine-protein kinase
MKVSQLILSGVTGVLVSLPCLAQPPVLEFPLDRQVFQRNAEEWAEVKVAGTVPTNATLVEVKTELAAGLRGKAVAWTIVAQGEQIKDGRFSGSLKLDTGGWYTLTVRFRRSADDTTSLAETTVEHVGVGDVFVTAGQSNSVNYGKPRQKSAETLSVYFNGKEFTPAADPIPDACGDGGTPWPILGDLVSRTTRAPVCFRSATVNWLRVREWIPGASSGNIERLVARAKWFGPAGFRAVLWVQGEADAGRPDFTPAEQYEREAKAMIEFSRQQLGWPVDWFVAGTCYCPPQGTNDWHEGMTAVLHAQQALWDKGIAHRGPDTNDIIGSPDYRHDGIHFGQRGLQIHAERWYAALSTHYQWANPLTSARK